MGRKHEESDVEEVPLEEVAPEVESVSIEEKILDFDKKVEAINNSQMPEAQKAEYIRSLKPKVEVQGIPFSVYAKVRKIEKSRLKAMLAYPKAKDVRLASLEDWDEIFKNF